MRHLTLYHCYKWKSLHAGGEGTQQDKTEDIFSGAEDGAKALCIPGKHSTLELYPQF